MRTRFVPWAKWSYVNLEVETVPSMSWGAIKDQTSKLMSQAQYKNGEAIYKIMLKGSKDAPAAGELQELYTLGRVVSVTDARTYDFDFDSLYEANREICWAVILKRSGHLTWMKKPGRKFYIMALMPYIRRGSSHDY